MEAKLVLGETGVMLTLNCSWDVKCVLSLAWGCQIWSVSFGHQIM